MKQIIKNSIVLVVLCTTMFSYASEIVTNENDDATKVTLNDVTEGSVLSIKDVHGLILYKETIKVSGDYSKKFDLTSLPDGTYIFELDKDFEIKSIPFNVKRNVVNLNDENQTVIFKPAMVLENNMLRIQKTILNSEKGLNIKIYFENGDLVHSEKFNNEKLINKTYDFSKSLNGKYKVLLSTEDRTFIKEINL
ncbi:hypothetical protein JBL43_05920 [Aureibaculum sp. A20]|uniref:T9SS C-terminal target domain-containing protein n=1 Tax=Aureibaculum flavum TaxID=2795986 RepID=A0ABS0WPB0_9FLAO|nr:hypothetical protein [Aureibaculum flavum]MBJ2173764.1 hypothetical protein [Aureibaculum flavum]MBJ2173766.1 hypothetical protein [Aureibaculum flavum]